MDVEKKHAKECNEGMKPSKPYRGCYPKHLGWAALILHSIFLFTGFTIYRVNFLSDKVSEKNDTLENRMLEARIVVLVSIEILIPSTND